MRGFALCTSERKVGGRSGTDGCSHVAIVFVVQQPWTVSTMNTRPESIGSTGAAPIPRF